MEILASRHKGHSEPPAKKEVGIMIDVFKVFNFIKRWRKDNDRKHRTKK